MCNLYAFRVKHDPVSLNCKLSSLSLSLFRFPPSTLSSALPLFPSFAVTTSAASPRVTISSPSFSHGAFSPPCYLLLPIIHPWVSLPLLPLLPSFPFSSFPFLFLFLQFLVFFLVYLFSLSLSLIIIYI